MRSIPAMVIDAIAELINIGVGHSAGILSEITKAHVTLAVPEVRIIIRDEFSSLYPFTDEAYSVVNIAYTGPFNGSTALIFPEESAEKLVCLMTNIEPFAEEFQMMKQETLLEVGNIIINGTMGSFSNILGGHLHFQVPEFADNSIQVIMKSNQWFDSSAILIGKTHFSVQERNIEGEVLLVLDLRSMDEVIYKIESCIGNKSK